MRLQHLYELSLLLFGLALSSFFFFDEEPVLDFSDWSIVHISLLSLCALVVVFELMQRAKVGQMVYKDQSTLIAALNFWFMVENYVRVVILVFAMHSLTPLEAELLELNEAFFLALNTLAAECLPAAFFLLSSFFFAHALNLTLAWSRYTLQLTLVAINSVCLVVASLLVGWQLMLAGLSSYALTHNPSTFYAAAKTSLTYNTLNNVADQFDWHKEATVPFVCRLEDLYFFFFQLLFVVTLIAATWVWLFFFLDIIHQGKPTLSYTQVAVGLAWLEHAACALLVILVWVVGLGFRVMTRTPFEFSWLTLFF